MINLKRILFPIEYLFQAHLLSVFDNTKSVKFDQHIYDKILEVISQEGEAIPLVDPVVAQVRFFEYPLLIARLID